MKPRKLTDSDHNAYRNAIGLGFKKLRLKAGKTIDQVSLDVDIQPSILQLLEKGDYDLELGEYIDLCDYYNIKPAEFMENLEID